VIEGGGRSTADDGTDHDYRRSSPGRYRRNRDCVFLGIPAVFSDPGRPSGCVSTLILPVTGSLPRHEELFDALLGQSLTPTRLIVATESREDPAYDRVAGLIEPLSDAQH